MKIFTIITLSLLICSPLFGQTERSGWKTSRNWEPHKHEMYFTVGASGFLGDLGGLNKIGTTKSPVDLDWESVRMMAGGGYRFRFHPRFATTTQLAYAMLSGKDSNTDEIIRRSRNLSFRAHLIELGQRFEFILYAKEASGSSYQTTDRERADLLYVFAGINGFFYQPQTKINEGWVNLRPLKTEGQGMPDGAEQYGMFNFGIPVGIGMRWGLQGGWRLGLEISYVKTFTDYLDDTSTDYYDPSALYSTGGADAVYAGNPAIENHQWFGAGQQRGNPDDNDAYMYLNVTITKNITSGRNVRRTRFRSRSKF